MRLPIRLGLSLLFSVLVVGCTDNTGNIADHDFGSSGGGDGGSPDGNLEDAATLDGPMVGLDIGTNPNGPMITVTSPMPNDEVAGNTLHVTATIVAQGGSSVSADSVQIIVPSANGSTTTAPMTLTPMPNVWKGQADISAIPTGSSNFVVKATDTLARTSVATVTYVHDRGPNITFVSPSAPTAKGSVTVEVIVDDPLHPITAITSVKAGIRQLGDIALTQVAGATPFRATGTIDFSKYNPVLDGPQLITVQAINSKGTIGTAQKQFTVDNAGPDIMITNPKVGAFVGGVLEIKATITDISGVQDSSVLAVFGNNLATSVQLTRLQPGGDDFHGYYDVRQFGRNYVLPSLSVRADDTLGNHGELGIEIVIDNTPPHLELDPPSIRLAKINMGGVECSRLFDPVGDESLEDGSISKQVLTLKARIEDDGNVAPGLLVVRYAGLDPSSIFLYAMPSSIGGATQALNVDTGAHPGHCDSINPLIQPISTMVTSANQAFRLTMVPLAQGGAADYTEYNPSPPPPYNQFCNVLGETGTMPPPPLCTLSGTDLTVVTPHPDPNVGNSAIFTIPPVVASATGCIGYQLDSQNALPEGPTCISVVATDLAGNSNVSPPMRVCIDRGGGKCNAWDPNNPATWPDCTGTYDKATNKTDPNTHCTPYTDVKPTYDTRFPSVEVIVIR